MTPNNLFNIITEEGLNCLDSVTSIKNLLTKAGLSKENSIFDERHIAITIYYLLQNKIKIVKGKKNNMWKVENLVLALKELV